jgi:hypothetical protein
VKVDHGVILLVETRASQERCGCMNVAGQAAESMAQIAPRAKVMSGPRSRIERVRDCT